MNQAKNTLLGLAAILVVFGGIVWISNRNSGQAGGKGAATVLQGNGRLEAKEKSYDFGTVSMANGKVTRAFEITNPSSETVNVKKVYTSCMCTQALIKSSAGREFGPFGMPGHGGASPWANVDVAPGEAIVLEAVFDPAAHGPSGVGVIDRAVYLETNSKETPKVELTFHATVTR